MSKNKYTGFIVAFAAICGAVACTDELKLTDGNNDNPGIQTSKLQAVWLFDDSYEDQPATRFSTNPQDNWSIGGSQTTFTSSDTVGIFARWGNMNLPTTDGRGGPLVNVPMFFVKQDYEVPKDPSQPNGAKVTAYTLENDTVELYTPGMLTGNGVFMYYPYTPDIGNIDNYPFWRKYVDAVNYQNGSMYWEDGYVLNQTNNNAGPDDIFPVIPGLELRVKADDGSVRCRDVIEMFTASTADLAKGIISGAPRHGFSSLIITRGKGFDKPVRIDPATGDSIPDETITVVMNKAITHMRVVSYISNNVHWTTQLFYQDGYEFNGEPMDTTEAKKWVAWEGSPYDFKGEVGTQRAWYVIVPSVYNTNTSTSTNILYKKQYSPRPSISEIQLRDNDGYLQHVTSFTLKTSDGASPTKAPYPYYRWPIVIEMTELGPTVRPADIEEWEDEGDDKDLTEIRGAGIHDIQELKDWAIAYNGFVSNGRADETELNKYGSKIDNIWHFYVSGIDFSGATLPVIEDLQDVLEGDNQLYNVEWANIRTKEPVFKKITRNGAIKNIDFANIYLNSSETTEGVGALAGEVNIQYAASSELQTFDNCNVTNATVLTSGPVGLLAGSVEFCRINKCTFSGFTMGASTSENKLFGAEPSQSIIPVNTEYSNIIFSTR